MNFTITSAAAEKINELINGNPNARGLRVYVEGGGCSGFQYGFMYAETKDDDDTVFEKDGAHVVIDIMSAPYLEEAVLDFEKDVMSEHFVIRNPNAQTKCGCGHSFSV